MTAVSAAIGITIRIRASAIYIIIGCFKGGNKYVCRNRKERI